MDYSDLIQRHLLESEFRTVREDVVIQELNPEEHEEEHKVDGDQKDGASVHDERPPVCIAHEQSTFSGFETNEPSRLMRQCAITGLSH